VVGPSPLDNATIAALYESRARPLARLLRRVSGLSCPDAEGVVHDAFLALIGSPREIASPVAWLTRVALRIAAKRRRALRALAPLEALGDRATPRPDVEILVDLRRALGRLSRRRRQFVLLRHVAGWTSVEIARASGLSSGTVRLTVHQGIARLREDLESVGST
jgi:RNA polymerase sigma-70 factor, ECF subfamily